MDQIVAAPNDDTPTIKDVPPFLVDEIAMVAHKLDQEYRYALDPSFRISVWAYLRDGEKNEIRANVHAILSGKSKSDEEQHQIWYETKTREGWKWGSKEDRGAKEHPLLMPYDLLPVELRMKDRLFRAVVVRAAAQKGFATPAQ